MDTRNSHQLVDHFFRHESGRLVGVLAREFGVRRLELAEDSVQQALSRALQTWGQQGIPQNPGGWLYRVARNCLIDSLRRNTLEQRYQQLSPTSAFVPSQAAADVDEELVDESLRLLFLCCHPALPYESRLALALKLVGGFSIHEISAALMTSSANTEKRVYRALATLREGGTELADLDSVSMAQRLEAVESTIYLMFNEGYASVSSATVLRRDVCEEAIRLCRMLSEPRAGSQFENAELHSLARPATAALMALMLMHLARFEARIADDGAIIVMEDQDRSLWNYGMIREAMGWMAVSAAEDHLSRYHVEAAIAWEHCRADSFDAVDWRKIVELYNMLDQIQPGPMVRLNLAIASMYAHGNEEGLRQIIAIDGRDRQRLRPWWDGALATVYQRLGNHRAAAAHFQDAGALTTNPALKQFFASKLAALRV